MGDEHEREAKPDERLDDGADEAGAAAQPIPVAVSYAGAGREERFRALTEHARDAIVEITADARMLYVSPSYTEIFGYAPHEVLGTSALDLVHPDDRSQVDAIRQQAMAEETAAQLVFRLRHRDGSWRWVELAGRPYRTPEGELRAVLVARDITDRIRAERSLQEQLEVETRIANLSQRFLNVEFEEFDTCLQEGLEAAGDIAGADRVQFVVLNHAADGIGGDYQWCAEGIPPHREDDWDQVIDRYRWSATKLLAGEVIHAPRVSDLPPEAEPERRGLEADGVRSYFAIPIRRDGLSVGFLDFFRMREERGWTEPETTRLRLIAEVLTSALRRLHAEQERRATEERFYRLTQHARDTICEMTLDGRYLYVSRNFADLSGYTLEEVESLDTWSLIHPDDLEEVRRRSQEVIDSIDGTALLSYRVRRRDGGWNWLESTLSRFETPSGEGRLAVVIRDATRQQNRRLELETRLELEERVTAFSRELLEKGAGEIDAGIRHGLEAAAALVGADRAYLVTSPNDDETDAEVYDWHAPGVPPRRNRLGMKERWKQRWVSDMLRQGRTVRVSRYADLPEEARHVREALAAEGVRSLLCIPINSDGRLLGVLGFHCLGQEKEWSEHEITLLRLLSDVFTSALRRKRAEVGLEESQRRLLQAQKMEAVGTLAGGIAHDFNNQLTVMLANARYVMRQIHGDDDVKRALDDLNRAADHCAQLTRSLLAFSRRTPVSPHPLDAARVLSDVEELLRPLISSSIDFRVVPHDGGAQVVADPTQLQQVLINLVVNSRDAMPDGGRLVLTTASREVPAAEAERLDLAEPGRYVEFTVEDSGCGMDESVRARIFEPFFTTKGLGEGTGLGLATAYGIVQECRGSIVVESRPGEGATFRVLLPESRERSKRREDEMARAGTDGSETILLAEDEESVRRLVARILREAGYGVLEARDGAEAMRLGEAYQGRLTALVTDVDMPHVGGIELATRLAAARPELPVLIISGTSHDPLRGADAPTERSRFLPKPFTDQLLLDSLRALLGERRTGT